MSKLLHLLVAAMILLGGCGSDDSPPSGSAGEADADTDGTDPADAGADTDDAAFPPVNPRVSRPDDLTDLTGMARVEIEAADNVYRPRNFIVDPGTEIVFINVGRNPHNVVPAAEGAFDLIPDSVLEQGPAVLVLDAVGDYPFYCSIHGGATFGQTGYAVVSGG